MRGLIIGISALVLASATAAAAGAATTTGAATIHACVKKHTGATRIVSAKAKCRHGEQKLSWSTVGPAGTHGVAGANGQPGANGANGPSGVAAAFNAFVFEAPVIQLGTVNKQLTKVLPPGSYAVSAKVELTAEAESSIYFGVGCTLVDTPGIEGSLVELKTLDIANWETRLSEVAAKEFKAVNTLPFVGVLTSNVTSTVTMLCNEFGTPAGLTVHPNVAQLVALQVGSIG
jgi:hypothetical protein